MSYYRNQYNYPNNNYGVANQQQISQQQYDQQPQQQVAQDRLMTPKMLQLINQTPEGAKNTEEWNSAYNSILLKIILNIPEGSEAYNKFIQNGLAIFDNLKADIIIDQMNQQQASSPQTVNTPVV
jgi:hypothetical protein